MKPIPLHVLAKQLGLSPTSNPLVRGMAVDSRKLMAGDLFFALPGARTQGTEFLQEVAAKGAVAAFVPSHYRGPHYDLELLFVPDVLEALQTLAKRQLAASPSKVIAITGSLGKTTTKEFTAALLKSHYKICATPLSYNTKITVPLTILLAEGDEDYLVLEMGMSAPGDLDKLVAIAPPDIALITTVAVQHASQFSNGLSGIVYEKGRLFSHPKTQLALLHQENPHYAELAAMGSAPKRAFSLSDRFAPYFLERTRGGLRLYEAGKALGQGEEIVLSLPLEVHYQNFLAAASIALSLQLPWSALRESAQQLNLPPMRFEKVSREGILFINDAYNANPDSMKAAIEGVPAPQPGGRVIAVLGEMDALGSYTESSHALIAEVALQHVDCLLCLGNHCKTIQRIWQREGREVLLFESRSELEKQLKEMARPGDVVLLKGARKHQLEEILTLY